MFFFAGNIWADGCIHAHMCVPICIELRSTSGAVFFLGGGETRFTELGVYHILQASPRDSPVPAFTALRLQMRTSLPGFFMWVLKIEFKVLLLAWYISYFSFCCGEASWMWQLIKERAYLGLQFQELEFIMVGQRE